MAECSLNLPPRWQETWLPIVFLVEIRNISVRETGSRINRHHAPMENVFNVKYLDKMLSYRRETALQGAL